MEVQVRKAVEADLPSILPSVGPRGDPPWDPFTSLEGLRGIPREGLLVAEANGELVGFIHWFPVTETDAKGEPHQWARIYNLFVDERARRKGVGKRLVAAALKQILGGSFEYVRIDTSDGNTAARRLYEQFGFVAGRCQIEYRLNRPAP